MSVFAVSMWLACKSDDPDILEAFDARWTPKLKRDWDRIVVDSPLADLSAALNKKIYDDCGAQIGKDFPSGAGIDGVDAFVSTSWHPGSGGLHESGLLPVKATKGGVYVGAWSFSAKGGKTGFMYVACNWAQVKVLTPPSPAPLKKDHP